MTSASDEKWRTFNCFFSRVTLRTYQHPCNVTATYFHYKKSLIISTNCSRVKDKLALLDLEIEVLSFSKTLIILHQSITRPNTEDHIINIRKSSSSMLFKLSSLSFNYLNPQGGISKESHVAIPVA